MIICKVTGGLGNQLFQYFNALSLSKKTGKKIYIDASSYNFVNDHAGYQLDKFGVTENRIPDTIGIFVHHIRRVYRKLFRRDLPFYVEQKDFEFKEVELKSSFTHIEGTFQSEKFFQNVRSEVKSVLSIELDDDNYDVLDDIKKHESIAIHIRRGDYVSNPDASKIIGACSKDYYQKAISLINEEVDSGNNKYYVFTDDIQWVKDNLEFNSNHVYIDINSGSRAHFDIALMRACRHNIISNSTFSWMGAWGKEGYVVAPTPWFNDRTINDSDLYCNSWTRLAK